MTRDEHKEIVNKMLGFVTAEHQADASALLTNLSEDYEKVLTESETLSSRNETLIANNEKLREVNADLFLKVGTTKKETENNANQGGEPDEETPLDYNELFNEKGELK